MYMRTFLTLLSAATLSAAAATASLCGTSGPADNAGPAAAVAVPAGSAASNQDQPGVYDNARQTGQGADSVAALLAHALAERQSKFGEAHPITIETANALAAIYKAMGRYKESEALYIRSLEACQRALGYNHRLTRSTMRDLASLYKVEERQEGAALLTSAPRQQGPRDIITKE